VAAPEGVLNARTTSWLGAPPDYVIALGFRRCYRRPSVQHHPNNLRCDCLRVELPIEAQAESSGALGTPDRNHDCHLCSGTGENHSFGVSPCPRCAGTGELRADRSPLGSPPGEFRRVVDTVLESLPDHPVGSRWLWKGDPGESDVFLTVIKVTKNTVTMRADEGWSVQFREKQKAFRAGKLSRLAADAELRSKVSAARKAGKLGRSR
jgi:hypothetical protein